MVHLPVRAIEPRASPRGGRSPCYPWGTAMSGGSDDSEEERNFLQKRLVTFGFFGAGLGYAFSGSFGSSASL